MRIENNFHNIWLRALLWFKEDARETRKYPIATQHACSRLKIRHIARNLRD